MPCVADLSACPDDISLPATYLYCYPVGLIAWLMILPVNHLLSKSLFVLILCTLCRAFASTPPVRVKSLQYNQGIMDPADFAAWRGALDSQEQRLGSHEETLKSLLDQMTHVSTQLTHPPWSVSGRGGCFHLFGHSCHFSDSCREFLTQIQMVFIAQPSWFGSKAAKLAYIANLLETSSLSLF